jgi:8-oxo-dGTP pyrophosphatase MutT (NUDIX family)
MRFNNKENKKIKLPDNRIIWLSRSCAMVATVCLVKDSTPYFLITKRGPGAADNYGKWCLPCGYIDGNESSYYDDVNGYGTFFREIYEETGLIITRVEHAPKTVNYKKLLLINEKTLRKFSEPWKINSHPNKDARENITIHHYFLQKTNELPTPNILNPEEVSEIKWISIYEIDKYEYAFNHDETIKEFINKFEKKIIKLKK